MDEQLMSKYECSQGICLHLPRDIQKICRGALSIALSCAARATPTRGHLPLLPLLTGFSARMPLLPGLSTSINQIPFTNHTVHTALVR